LDGVRHVRTTSEGQDALIIERRICGDSDNGSHAGPSNATTSTGGTSRSRADARSPNAQLARAGKQSKAGRQAIRDGDKMAAAVQRSNSDLDTTAVSTVTSAHEAVEIKHIHVHEVKGSAMQDLRTQIDYSAIWWTD